MLGGLGGLDLRSALATRSFLGRRRRISVRLLDRFDALVEGGPLVLEALHSTTFHLNFVPVDTLAVGLELRDDTEKKLALDRYRGQCQIKNEWYESFLLWPRRSRRWPWGLRVQT